jgi:hypothetical protein
MIQTALHGHQTAIQQLQQVSNICRQVEQMVQVQYNSSFAQNNNQNHMVSPSFTQPLNTFNSNNTGMNTAPFKSMQ